MARRKKLTKPTPPPRNPFDGKDFVLIEQAYKKDINKHTGEVSELYVDPSGLTSYWVYTGEFVILDGDISKPPSVGGVSPEILEKAKANPMDGDSILAASAISFCNSNNKYNNGRYEAAVDAVVNYQKTGGQGRQKPVFPSQPEMDQSKWVAGVQYYRPCNFSVVYQWMIDHDSGRNPGDVHIPLPPELDFNSGPLR